MAGILDVFGQDAFSLQSLTVAINMLPFKPSRLGDLGLFAAKGITKTTAVIESKEGHLSLLPTAPRGGVGVVKRSEKRTVRSFPVPHIPYDKVILPEDIQDVRAFGSETTEETVASIVNDLLASMRQDHELTEEWHRVGAIKGTILDADGSEIFNLFTEFGVTETTVDFLLGTAGTDIRDKILAVLDVIEDNLGQIPSSGVRAFCGRTWFRRLIAHSDVKAAFDRWRDGEARRNDPRSGFEFAGVIFEEYRGTIGTREFIPTNEARFVAMNVPDLFVTSYAPGDFIETVNTVGKPVYAKQEAGHMNRSINLHTQSNHLCLCTRPATLVKGSTSN